jgi:mannose-6-phosphate isomerase-like protein (cupin superfamily)
LITRSQAFKESIQEVRHKNDTERNGISGHEILAWARQKDSRCDLVIPEMTDGEALFFDGWLWHASHNTSQQRRTALLLQYATPDTPIRIPDQNNFEWPFKTLQNPKPPCIMVSGSDHFGVNRIVPPPVLHDGHEKYALSNRIYTMDVPLQPDHDKNWKPFPIFKGSSPNLQSITCHVSALNPGHTPHPPHQHKEEEILLLLSGEAELTLPDLEKKGLSASVPIKQGEFVYYPAWFYHTITAKGNMPANYIMFKWYNEKGERRKGRMAEC